MLRPLLSDAKRCYLHPHRLVKTTCARCKTAYCEECLEQRDTGLFAKIVQADERQPAPLFCARCIAEVEALEQMEAWRHRPLWQRLIPTRAALNRAAIYVAVIAVIMVPMSFAVRSLAATTLSPEELARIKQGIRGGFWTADGINLVSQVYGGNFIRASAPSQPGHDPAHLIDTWKTAAVPGWRSADATFPQSLVFQLPQQVRINSVILRPQPEEPDATAVKDFAVYVSTSPDDASFHEAVAGQLPPPSRIAPGPEGEAGGVRFDFPDQVTKYVLLQVRSNYGSADYTSLGELEVYWSPSTTPATTTTTPSGITR